MTRSLWPFLKRRKWTLLAIAVVMLPLSYVLSIGPVVWLMGRGWIAQKPAEFLYHPVEFAYEIKLFHKLGCEAALVRYVSWFYDNGAGARRQAVAPSSSGRGQTGGK